MSTALATLDKDTSFDEIARITGQSQDRAVKSFLPRFKINKDFETDEGVQIPPGTYALTLDTGTVYAKTAAFRPFINAFQYQIYDEPTNTYPNKTIIFKTWSEEAIDEKGTVKCGKVTGKAKDKLTEEQVAAQKIIKCYRNVYGTVTLTGNNEKGEEVIVENEPCLWRVSGSAFQPIGDALDIVTASKRPYFAAELDLNAPQRQKKGATIYYTPVIKTNSKVLPYAEAELVLLKKFQETIDFENRPVIEKYKKAKGFVEQADAMEEIIEAGFIDMTDDLNDDIGI